MVQDIISNTLILGFVVLLSFLVDYKNSIKYWYVLILVFIIGFIDGLFHSLTMGYPNIQIINSHIWNNNLN